MRNDIINESAQGISYSSNLQYKQETNRKLERVMNDSSLAINNVDINGDQFHMQSDLLQEVNSNHTSKRKEHIESEVDGAHNSLQANPDPSLEDNCSTSPKTHGEPNIDPDHIGNQLSTTPGSNESTENKQDRIPAYPNIGDYSPPIASNTMRAVSESKEDVNSKDKSPIIRSSLKADSHKIDENELDSNRSYRRLLSPSTRFVSK